MTMKLQPVRRSFCCVAFAASACCAWAGQAAAQERTAAGGGAATQAPTTSAAVPPAPSAMLPGVDPGVERLRALTVREPKNPDGWIALGIVLYGTGQARLSADALAHGLALRPEDSRAMMFLALAQADTGACDAAVPVLRTSFAAEAQGQRKLAKVVGMSLMSCLATLNKPLDALAVSSELQTRLPDDADVLYASAELYTRLWTETAGRLAATHPDSFRVHQLAGEVYEAQGNYEQAIREYRAALAENATAPGLRFRLGQMLLHKGGESANGEASVEFRKELAANPQSGVSALALGEIERHENHLDAAEADYRLALGINPELTAAQVGLAQVLLARNDTVGARKEVDSALLKHPDDPEAHYISMMAYRKAGDMQRAAKEMETFRTLQAAKQNQFNRTLDALLAGKPTADAAVQEPAGAMGQRP